jgi:hypothetical protein
MRWRVVLLISLTVFVSCGLLRSPRVTVKNESGTIVKDIRVSGRGFDTMIPLLQPGKSKTLGLPVEGESSINIEFTSGSKHYVYRDLAYIEHSGGYHIQLTIDTVNKVDWEDKTRIYW